MEKWNIFPYANPKGWHYTSRERAEGEWTCEHDKKEIATYNGHPFGVPIWKKSKISSINGPTLRGAHYPLPSVATKNNCADQNLDFVKLVKPRLIARPWSSNYGQNQCNLCQNMRQDVAFEVEPSKIIVRVVRPRRKPAKFFQNICHLPSTLPSSPKIG